MSSQRGYHSWARVTKASSTTQKSMRASGTTSSNTHRRQGIPTLREILRARCKASNEEAADRTMDTMMRNNLSEVASSGSVTGQSSSLVV